MNISLDDEEFKLALAGARTYFPGINPKDERIAYLKTLIIIKQRKTFSASFLLVTVKVLSARSCQNCFSVHMKINLAKRKPLSLSPLKATRPVSVCFS